MRDLRQRAIALILQWDESFGLDLDTLTGANDAGCHAQQADNRGRPPAVLSPTDIEGLHAAMQKYAKRS